MKMKQKRSSSGKCIFWVAFIQDVSYFMENKYLKNNGQKYFKLLIKSIFKKVEYGWSKYSGFLRIPVAGIETLVHCTTESF